MAELVRERWLVSLPVHNLRYGPQNSSFVYFFCGFVSELTRTYAKTVKFAQEEIKTFEWFPMYSLRRCFVRLLVDIFPEQTEQTRLIRYLLYG